MTSYFCLKWRVFFLNNGFVSSDPEAVFISCNFMLRLSTMYFLGFWVEHTMLAEGYEYSTTVEEAEEDYSVKVYSKKKKISFLCCFPCFFS